MEDAFRGRVSNYKYLNLREKNLLNFIFKMCVHMCGNLALKKKNVVNCVKYRSM